MRTNFLLVDDDALLRNALRRVLCRAFGEEYVHVADGPVQARMLIEKSIPLNATLFVISDHNMPDGNGFDLLVSLQERLGKRLRGRILLTGGNDNLREEAAALGIEFLSKPASSDDLHAAIRRVLDPDR